MRRHSQFTLLRIEPLEDRWLLTVAVPGYKETLYANLPNTPAGNDFPFRPSSSGSGGSLHVANNNTILEVSGLAGFAVAPRVIASSIQQNDLLGSGTVTYTARFDEPFLVAVSRRGGTSAIFLASATPLRLLPSPRPIDSPAVEPAWAGQHFHTGQAAVAPVLRGPPLAESLLAPLWGTFVPCRETVAGPRRKIL